MSETPRDIFEALLTQFGYREPGMTDAEVAAERAGWLARFDAASPGGESAGKIFDELLEELWQRDLPPLLPSDEIDKWRERFVTVGRADGWISVEERLPEEFKPVLIAAPGIDRAFCGWYTAQGWIDAEEGLGLGVDGVTHWRPLPPLPEPPK